MNVGVLDAAVELLSNDLLPVAVGEEVYRPGRDDPYERRPETLEQGARRFIPVDIPSGRQFPRLCYKIHLLHTPNDMGSLQEMPKQT